MVSTTSMGDSVGTYLEALGAMNRYLAVIKGRVEIILLAGCPEYIQSDLITVSDAEREITQLVRCLSMALTKSAKIL